jgi:four helix bundle protein
MSILAEHSFSFAIKCVAACKNLQYDKEFVISKQLLRSSTAIGALGREAKRAESRLDFRHKLSIALKEADESLYWLELLFATHYIDKAKFDELSQACEVIIKILVTDVTQGV